MSLSSSQLDAFLEVSKTGSFSAAAEKLFITQSALSQKIKILEEDLKLTLFLRTPTGVRLTEQGEKLIRYCQVRDSLEEELMKDLSVQKSKNLSGVLRLGCFSSVYRSVIVPSLAPLLTSNPEIKSEFTCATMPFLPNLLKQGEVDFIVLDYKLEKPNIESCTLGREKYVVVESKKKTKIENVFLDNDADDLATSQFFKLQKIKPNYTRAYFHDCYGIIDAVAEGLGSAVMPEHLVKDHPGLKISQDYKPIYFDTILHYYAQPFYTELQKAVIANLKKNSTQYF